jgi:hypothetical protein
MNPGYTFIELAASELGGPGGSADPKAIRRISVGGTGQSATVHAWTMHGSRLLPLHGAAPSPEPQVEDAPIPPDFDLSQPGTLQFESEGQFSELVVDAGGVLDLFDAPLRVVIHAETQALPTLRVAVDSATEVPWSRVTELPLDLAPETTYVVLTGEQLIAAGGKANVSAVRRMSIGGRGRSAKLLVWVMHGPNRLKLSPPVVLDQN